MAFLACLACHNFSYRTEALSDVIQISINRSREPKVAIKLLIKMSHFTSGFLGAIFHRKIGKNHQFWCRVVMGPPPTPLHPTPFASHAVHPQIAILPFIEQHPFHHLELSHLHKICIILQNNENAFILKLALVGKELTDKKSKLKFLRLSRLNLLVYHPKSQKESTGVQNSANLQNSDFRV